MSAAPEPAVSVPLRVERDIAAARLAVSKACDALGAGALRKTRLVTAVSEIARNALEHGGGGDLEIEVLRAPARIRVTCRDYGPGIADIEQAMVDGFTTARSMGKGLGGARRLVDEFDISNAAGGGLRVRMQSKL